MYDCNTEFATEANVLSGALRVDAALAEAGVPAKLAITVAATSGPRNRPKARTFTAMPSTSHVGIANRLAAS